MVPGSCRIKSQTEATLVARRNAQPGRSTKAKGPRELGRAVPLLHLHTARSPTRPALLPWTQEPGDSSASQWMEVIVKDQEVDAQARSFCRPVPCPPTTA